MEYPSPIDCECVTIEFIKDYDDINDVLYWLVEQAQVGIPYCLDAFPPFKDPAEMYYYFLNRVTYHDDPIRKELIQGPCTLFEENFYGIPGAGDCDCFVTLLLASCWANGWTRVYILLYGKTKQRPTHISMCVDFDGRTYYMDLTEKKFDVERFYPYRQKLPVFK